MDEEQEQQRAREEQLARAGPGSTALKQQEEPLDRSVRRVYEQAPSSKHEARLSSNEKAARLALMNSKNPNADFNNPNNPNYKGRLRNKEIGDQYLAKQRTKVSREVSERYDVKAEHLRDFKEEKDVYKKSQRHDPDSYYSFKYGSNTGKGVIEDFSEEEMTPRDYHHAYGEDYYSYKKPAYRRDEYYEDDRYGRYPDDRDRYARFGVPPQGHYAAPQRTRGRGRGRGQSMYSQYEEDYMQHQYKEKRGYPSKYYGNEDAYYYEDAKYDKKRNDYFRQYEDARDYPSSLKND